MKIKNELLHWIVLDDFRLQSFHILAAKQINQFFISKQFFGLSKTH